MGGALKGCEIFRFIKQPEIAFLWIIRQKVWLDAKILSIRRNLSCSQQSHPFEPFELKIPGEAACYLNLYLIIFLPCQVPSLLHFVRVRGLVEEDL